MGRTLAREHPVEADLVMPTPESGTPAAIGYAQESGIPYGQGLVKNSYVGRTFIAPSQTHPPARHPAQAQPAARGHPGQAPRRRRRLDRARQHPARARPDAARGRGGRGARAHLARRRCAGPASTASTSPPGPSSSPPGSGSRRSAARSAPTRSGYISEEGMIAATDQPRRPALHGVLHRRLPDRAARGRAGSARTSSRRCPIDGATGVTDRRRPRSPRTPSPAPRPHGRPLRPPAARVGPPVISAARCVDRAAEWPRRSAAGGGAGSSDLAKGAGQSSRLDDVPQLHGPASPRTRAFSRGVGPSIEQPLADRPVSPSARRGRRRHRGSMRHADRRWTSWRPFADPPRPRRSVAPGRERSIPPTTTIPATRATARRHGLGARRHRATADQDRREAAWAALKTSRGRQPTERRPLIRSGPREDHAARPRRATPGTTADHRCW